MSSSQLNLANAITIARILLIPVFLVLLLSGIPQPYGDIAAAAVFILAAATDKLDGYVARRNKQITTLGQFLDPLADKLLIAAALIALVSQGRIVAWVAMLIIGREIAVSVLRIVGVSQGVSIPADKYGKLKTVLQIVYVVYVLVPTDRHRRAHPRVHRRGHRHPVDPGGRRGDRHPGLGRALLPERPRRHPHARESTALSGGRSKSADG